MQVALRKIYRFYEAIIKSAYSPSFALLINSAAPIPIAELFMWYKYTFYIAEVLTMYEVQNLKVGITVMSNYAYI